MMDGGGDCPPEVMTKRTARAATDRFIANTLSSNAVVVRNYVLAVG